MTVITDKLVEVDSTFILPPSLHQCSILRVFKAHHESYTERRDVISHAEIKLGTSCTKGYALTSSAILALGSWLLMEVVSSMWRFDCNLFFCNFCFRMTDGKQHWYFQSLNNVLCHLCINCKFNSILACSRLSDSQDVS